MITDTTVVSSPDPPSAFTEGLGTRLILLLHGLCQVKNIASGEAIQMYNGSLVQ